MDYRFAWDRVACGAVAQCYEVAAALHEIEILSIAIGVTLRVRASRQ